jgi:hypothetical protein
MKETLHSLICRFGALQQSWAQVPEVASHREQVWYAGLAVSPVEFTEQLAQLQGSLLRENSILSERRA